MEKETKEAISNESPIVLNVKSMKDHAVALTLGQLKWPELQVPALAVTHSASGETSKASAETAKTLLSSSRWNIAWLDLLDDRCFDAVQLGQRVNQFPGMELLTRKKNLAAQLNSMCRLAPAHYAFHPNTWLLPHELRLLAEQFAKGAASSDTGETAATETKSKSSGQTCTFIVKPDNLARGEGIYLVQSLSAVKTEQHAIAQSYISNPLLVQGRKFDMRIYALLTSVLPLRIFLFDDGLARFASEPYHTPATDNLGCKFMHLTNYSVNKSKVKDSAEHITMGGEDASTQGGKTSLVALRTQLREMGHDTDAMWRRVGDVVIKVLIAAQPTLAHAYRTHFPDGLRLRAEYLHGGCCFQLLGFDVLLDDKLNPWLCEVNRNPSLACGTDLDLRLKTAVLSELLRIVNPLPFRESVADYLADKRERRRLPPSQFKQWQTSFKEKVLAQRIECEEKAAAPAGEQCRFRRIFPLDKAHDAALFDDCFKAAQQAHSSASRSCRPARVSRRTEHKAPT